MNQAYVNPFINATIKLFEEIFHTTPVFGKPYLLKANETHNWDVSAMIGLAGETQGAVILAFSEENAAKIATAMIGSPKTALDEDVTDVIGELINIVAGNAKKDLEQMRILISLPTIITGSNHRIVKTDKAAVLVGIPFTSDKGDFQLLISMQGLLTDEDNF